MKISSLKLRNFRNYGKINLEFNDTLNIIFGNNGVGKTNLVEAIYALSITKSFRTNNDKNLIKKGELSTKIEGVVLNNTENNYQVIINKDGKKVKIDNNIVSKISDYISNIKIVLLQPDEHTIFNDSPSIRRKLLNIELSQLERDYIIYLNSYNKVLKQRNFYLKEMYINGNSSQDYLNILTRKLLEYGLIEEAGKSDLPGKPMTYKTTKDFLKTFGYSSLEELPELPRYKLDANKQIIIDEIIEDEKER